MKARLFHKPDFQNGQSIYGKVRSRLSITHCLNLSLFWKLQDWLIAEWRLSADKTNNGWMDDWLTTHKRPCQSTKSENHQKVRFICSEYWVKKLSHFFLNFNQFWNSVIIFFIQKCRSSCASWLCAHWSASRPLRVVNKNVSDNAMECESLRTKHFTYFLSDRSTVKAKLEAVVDRLARENFTLSYNEHVKSFYENVGFCILGNEKMIFNQSNLPWSILNIPQPNGHQVKVYKSGNNLLQTSVVNIPQGVADVNMLYLNGDVYAYTNTSSKAHCKKQDFTVSPQQLIQMAKSFIQDDCRVVSSRFFDWPSIWMRSTRY